MDPLQVHVLLPAMAPEGAARPATPPVVEALVLDARPVRERLLDVVRAQPGINKSELGQALGIAWGTVSYHVTRLSAAGCLVSEAYGRDRRLFPPGLAPAQRRSAVLRREEEAAQALSVLAQRRQASLGELGAHLGVSRKVARRLVRGLLEAGLVENTARGRPRYMLARPEAVALGRGILARPRLAAEPVAAHA